VTVVVLCCGFGFLLAEGNYRSNLKFNVEQTDLARWFARGEVSSNDLVITRFAGTAFDDCEWIPLLSDAQVLYCRNAQLTLTAQQNRAIQRLRETLYLYFDGKDQQWLANATQFEPYGLYGEISSFHTAAERSARIAALRREMLPLFEQIERRDPAIMMFFRRFQRIWVIENREDQKFLADRLSSYMGITAREDSRSLVITMATPR